ncbi:acetylesterase [Plantibacter sp. CFBP 8775]|uniref:acetylesterase n=1 Tax=Plantibacter sp. CFBP 8775 TaxID=2774038 RepID=UPI001782DD41|nr:acetylesterase [Plantibacter sp. CFBP 8775]MBD8104140.1 acetylesterase [Plantibacter sp. CFBP 8775]
MSSGSEAGSGADPDVGSTPATEPVTEPAQIAESVPAGESVPVAEPVEVRSRTESVPVPDAAVRDDPVSVAGHVPVVDQVPVTEPVEVRSRPVTAPPARDPGLRALAARFRESIRGVSTADGSLDATRTRLAEVLGLLPRPAQPEPAEDLGCWTRDGVDGVELRWFTGFGAPTSAWLLRPASESGVLPGALALHDHGGFTRVGREKLADGPDAVPATSTVTREEVQAFRDRYYGGRAVASDLARDGFAVLVHDAFGWGSRRIPDEAVAERFHRTVDLQLAGRRAESIRRGMEVAAVSAGQRSELLAAVNEPQLAKELGVLGTSFAGLVLRDDLIALDQLAATPGVRSGALACFGLSGGGARAVLLAAMDDRIRAAGVVAMMSTFDGVLDGHADQHSWSFLSPGLSRVGDWPELASLRPRLPLLVQYAERDELFEPSGMREAHTILTERYRSGGERSAYTGTFHDEPHSWSAPMQAELRAWLAAALA